MKDRKAGTHQHRRPALRAFLILLLCAASHRQSSSIQIPAATPLSIQLLQHVPMRAGESLEGRLVYPVYVDNRVAIPAGAILRGSIVQLDPDRSHRIHSRLRGDFTPFHTPVVRFDELVLPDGGIQPVRTNTAKDGVAIVRLSPPPGQKKRSLISREITAEKQRLKDAAAQFTAPGRTDRLVQFIYGQVPYHPERIEAGTAWTIDLSEPLDITRPLVEKNTNSVPKEKKPVSQLAQTEWRLSAYLQQTISSATKKPGDTFQAVVSEPIFGDGHAVVVPQGSLLVGEITQAKAARSFGRQGKLRFRFRELRLPSGFSQPVQATLAGVDSNKSANLQIDSEGGIQPQPQNRVLLPLALTFLAGRAFDGDGSPAAHSAVASNGFGIVGRVVGIAAGSRNLAAAIGFYGAALAFYDLWLAHGHDVAFAKNTRFEVTTTPRRNPMNEASSSR